MVWWGAGAGYEVEGWSLNCVITGAADGIGRALAGRFVAAGASVVGGDVDADRAK